MAGQFTQLEQVRMNPVCQLIRVVGETGPVDVSLQVMVLVLVWVQLRGVRRQEKHIDPVGVLVYPSDSPRVSAHLQS
jgi:hypothetical protein